MHHTLPGIFVSIMKHHFGYLHNKSYDTVGQVCNFFISNGVYNKTNFNSMEEMLFKVYRCENVNDANSLDSVFKKSIVSELQTIVINLYKKLQCGLTHNQKISENISLLTNDNFRPMTSLRDVDRTYEIGLNLGGDSDEEE